MIKLVSEINACYEGNEMRQKGKEGLVTARLDRVPCGRGDFVASKLINTVLNRRRAEPSQQTEKQMTVPHVGPISSVLGLGIGF